MTSTFYFVVDDTKESLQFEIVDESNNDTPIDITNDTVSFSMADQKLSTTKFTKVCSKPDPTNGIAQYDPDAAHFDTKGIYAGEVKIVFADAKIKRVRNIKIVVVDQLP